MPADLGEERDRERALRRMRAFAGGLLGVMFLVFLAARRLEAVSPALSYLRAFAEAALVGGAADWFAVTALFRRPLGLPIPHTALIPRNQQRIGQSVGRFVANNFLNPSVVLPKVKAMDAAGRLAGWLAQPANARFAARRLVAAGPPLLAALQDEPVRRMLRQVAVKRLQAVEAAPLLARLLTLLVAGGQHLALFDLGLEAATTFLNENRDSIRLKVSDKSGRWVPAWLDDKLARRILTGSLETLEEMRAADHPWRLQFQQSLADLIERLGHSAETRAQAEQIKAEIIAHPEVQAYLESLWSDGKALLLADLSHGDRIEQALAGAFSAFAGRLAEDGALHETVNGWVNRLLLHLILPNRQRLGQFMAGVVAGWDTPTLVDKLEVQVGRDLQYIRINGTVVGGLVGLLIHGLGTVLG